MIGLGKGRMVGLLESKRENSGFDHPPILDGWRLVDEAEAGRREGGEGLATDGDVDELVFISDRAKIRDVGVEAKPAAGGIGPLKTEREAVAEPEVMLRFRQLGE